MHTAVSEETGYWVRVAEFSVLGVSIPDFAIAVFPLGYQGIDGLVGMKVRPAERRMFLELIEKSES